MVHQRRHQGDVAEQQVAQYLQKQGYTIVTSNYHTRTGEVDIIATNRTTLIFVEVKMRTHSPFDLSQVITATKQKRIASAALHYLTTHGENLEKVCRFDVALVEQDTITYLENAFTTAPL